MKRMFALMLALLALLGMTARAETKASIVRMSDLTLTSLGEGGARSARFDKACLTLALGNPDGAPTLQANFDNGDGQVVDAVAQLAGREILLSVGGISGTYAIDLESFATDGNSADNLAKGLTKTLSLATTHLDVVLYALTQEQEDGMRGMEVPLPMPQLIGAVEALLSASSDTEDTQDIDGLLLRMQGLGQDAVLAFRYQPQTGAFELAAVQEGRGMQLSGTMEMTFEPMTFIDIASDEEKYDLMNLSPETVEQLRGELSMVLVKFMDYAGGAGL